MVEIILHDLGWLIHNREVDTALINSYDHSIAQFRHLFCNFYNSFIVAKIRFAEQHHICCCQFLAILVDKSWSHRRLRRVQHKQPLA